jgi:hypothetical protein
MEATTTSDEAVQEATGRTWKQWRAELDAMGASDLSHKEIARRLQEDPKVSGWWAQTITVEFERAIGRREVGQSCTGSFQTQASKTVLGGMDEVLARWQALVEGRAEFDGVPIDGEPSVSETDNWRYWRVSLADGTKINVDISEKKSSANQDKKSRIAARHEKLPDSDSVARWKAYWKEFIQGVARS